jgi:excisionase family DNA binding protein
MARLLKVPEAASRLNISEKTTWKMVYARRVDVVRIGLSVRIPEEAVEKLIDNSTTPADPDDGDR